MQITIFMKGYFIPLEKVYFIAPKVFKERSLNILLYVNISMHWT